MTLLNYNQIYREKIEGEIKILCEEFLDLIQNHVGKNSKQMSDKIYYNKCQADTYRYLAEITKDDEQHDNLLKAETLYNTTID